VRWGETVEQLKKDKVNQEGDMVLAAGFVAYIGPFTAVYREQLVASWIKRCQEYKIPVDTAFAMERSMVEAVRQRRLFVCLLISLLAIERTSAASSYGSARGTVESGLTTSLPEGRRPSVRQWNGRYVPTVLQHAVRPTLQHDGGCDCDYRLQHTSVRAAIAGGRAAVERLRPASGQAFDRERDRRVAYDTAA
jgi:hypothetical protein